MHEPSFISALAFFLGCGFVAWADPVQLSCTLDFPLAAHTATPAWLSQPQTPKTEFAALDLPLTAPEPGEALLVTISFHEKEGGFLRVIWKNGEGEQILSNNFYEGIGMDDQRMLLIPSTVMQSGGTLHLQCGDTTLGVSRISFQWLEAAPALVMPGLPDQEVIPKPDRALPASALDGQPPAEGSASLDGALITIPIASAPQRIEQGVQFALQLDGAPRAARISLEEAGLPFDGHLVVWVNQQRAGAITPAVPDLADPGFSNDPAKPYTGWRSGSIYLPVALLKKGLNALQFSVENDIDGTAGDTNAPLAVRHLAGQFDYAGSSAPSPLATARIAVPPLTSSLPPAALDDISTPGASAAAIGPLNPSSL